MSDNHFLPFVLQEMTNRVLAVTEEKAVMILSALEDRLDLSTITLSNGSAFNVDEMQALAAQGRTARTDSLTAGAARENYRPYEVINRVAVVPIKGTLTREGSRSMQPYSGMTGYDGVMGRIGMAQADSNVGSIYMPVSSAGGVVDGVAEASQFIFASSARFGGKPIIAHAADHAYSAAYELLAAADEASAPENGGAGSVGTLAIIPNVRGAMEKKGVSVTVMKSGQHKNPFNGIDEISDKAKGDMQARLDRARDHFAGRVAQYRGIEKKDVLETEGDSYMGREAKGRRLISAVQSEHHAWANALRRAKR